MHTQDDTSAKAHRAVRTQVKAPRGTTPPGPVPAAFDPQSRGALSPGTVAAIQRAAGNTAATRMIQRTATAEEQQSGAQSHQAYEQTVAEYTAARGPGKLYRAIRIESQVKRRQNKTTIGATADGNLGAGLSTPKEVAKVYQTLKQWPEAANIEPVDPDATFTVAHHVGGDNYGTQYVSFSPDRGRSESYAKYNFKDGPAENMDSLPTPRLVKRWAPVIEIDVSKLGAGNRLVNLGNPAVFAQTNLTEREEIGSMARNDKEVLIKGTIPSGAVTKVFGVEEVIQSMDREARTHLIEKEFKNGPRPLDGAPGQEEWDSGFKRNVPEHFEQYFAHLREQPPEKEYVPFMSAAERKRRAAEQGSIDPTASGSTDKKPAKKKKKQSGNLLSFAMDEA